MRNENEMKIKIEDLKELDGVELLKVYKVFRFLREETEDEYRFAVLQKMENFNFGEGLFTAQTNALFDLAEFYKNGTFAMRNFNRYRELILRAAKQGHIPALFELSLFHGYGTYGFKKDTTKMFTIWNYLKSFGHVKSLKALRRELLNGKGSRKFYKNEGDNVYKLGLLLKESSALMAEYETTNDYNHVVKIQDEAANYEEEIKRRVAIWLDDNVILNFEGGPYFEYDGMGS